MADNNNPIKYSDLVSPDNSITELITTMVSAGADLSKLDEYIKMENGIISIGSFVLNRNDNPEAYDTLANLFASARKQNGQSAI